MPTRSHHDQRGFSLAEILVAVAVFAIIFIAALMIYDRSNKVFKSGVESSSTQQATRVAFDKLVAELRMTGFDYDRDGIPTAAIAGINQYQQPDEQIEYIGQGAVTVRGNFDYETDGPPWHGREQAYEPVQRQFPLVTTGNDEIVTYVMASPTALGSSVSFFVDSFKPRKVYPVTTGAAQLEDQIVITSTVNASGQTLNVDQTNEYPPYTLYRVTLKEDASAQSNPNGKVNFTPVAENIRSLTLQYYEDAAGTVPLRDLANPPVVIPASGLATTVGGGGQYNPADPQASLVPRAIRGKIQSVRVTLIGMNEAPDPNYIDPFEAHPVPAERARLQRFRKYRLESLIAPRNYGRRGMREQEFKEPGQPTLTKVCRGYCGIFQLEWTAPPPDANTGGVESYAVVFDTDLTGGYSNFIDVGNVTSAFVSVPDPTQEWYFAVVAINSYGSETSPSMPSGPAGPGVGYPGKNATKPELTTDTTEYHASGGDLPEQANRVMLTWKTPTKPDPAPPAITCAVNPLATPAPSTNPSPVYPIQETKGFRVYRLLDKPPAGDQDTDPITDPKWEPVLNETAAGPGAPALDPLTNTVTWYDTTAANCVAYWYKIQAVERCPTIAANTSGVAEDNLSNISPPVFGQALSTATPAAPANLDIDYSGIPANSRCADLAPDPPLAANQCQAKLRWPKVQTDDAGNPMAVEYYVVERKKRKGATYVGGTDSFTLDSSQYTEVSGQLEYTLADLAFEEHDSSDSVDYTYEFQVRAKSCPNPPANPSGLGGLSPMRTFPCPFTGGTATTTLTNTMQGTGTSTNPWMISTPSEVAVTTTSPVTYMRATLNVGLTSLLICDKAGPPDFTSMGPAGCAWPSGLADEQVYRLDVFLQDPGGCTTTKNYFVMESNNNCCLTPQSIDATVVALDGPSGRVRIKLDNNCAEDLTIQNEGVLITWNSLLLSGTGGKRMTRVVYPKPGGGTTADDGSGCVPAGCTEIGNNCTSNPDGTGCFTSSDPLDADTNGLGLTTVAANSSSYFIDIRFNKTFTTNPVTKVCVQYRRPSDLGTQTCKIVPVPSGAINVCD